MTDYDLISQVRDDINKFLTQEIHNDIFHSECEFQLALGSYLKNKEYDNIHLEYFVPLEEIIKKENLKTISTGKNNQVKKYIDPKENFPWTSELSIDMVVEKNNEFVLVELKYKTTKINAILSRFGELLDAKYDVLKEQSAANDNSYHFWKDVRRIEKVSQRFSNIKGGLAVFLTNSETYRNTNNDDKPCRYSQFKLSPNLKPTTHKYWLYKDTDGAWKEEFVKKENDDCSKDGFELDHAYPIEWIDCKKVKNGNVKDTKFQYCIVEVRK